MATDDSVILFPYGFYWGVVLNGPSFDGHVDNPITLNAMVFNLENPVCALEECEKNWPGVPVTIKKVNVNE